MRLLGIRNVNLHQVVLPDLTGTPPRVRIKDPIHEPVFRLLGDNLYLGCGGQLVADALRSGHMVISARVVDCSDEEFGRYNLLDVAWSAANRRDRWAQYDAIAKVVDSFKPEAAYGVQEFVHSRLRAGRPRTVQGTAERMTAALVGVDLKTVRRAVRHAKALPTRRSVKWDAPFETFGLVDPKDSTLHALAEIQYYTHLAATRTEQALAALTSLLAKPDLVSLSRPGTLRRVQDNLRLLGVMLRAEVPASLCPVCKGLDRLQSVCTKCNGLGWVSDVGLRGMPAELLDTEDPRVLVDSKLVPVGEI